MSLSLWCKVMQNTTTHTIYFAQTRVDICSEPPSMADCLLEVEANMSVSRAKVVKKVETYKYIAIITSDVEVTFQRFKEQFVIVEAAGGVVENASQQLLMIFSRGRWDLPKGHVESGEKGCEAALREVEEETGIRCEVVGDSPLAHTWHAYDTYGRWELKRTEWWAMRPVGGELRPQSEEGIAEVRWLGGESLIEALKISYATIKQVVERYTRKRLL